MTLALGCFALLPYPTPPYGCPIVSCFREDFFRHRYAYLWLPARIRGCYEPLSILFMSIWVSYNTWGSAKHHMTEAAVLGAILGASFLVALFQTCMGLTFGGRWRRMPRGVSWSLFQKLAMVRHITTRVYISEKVWSVNQQAVASNTVIYSLSLYLSKMLLPFLPSR